MTLKDYKIEEIKEMSMVEVTYELMTEEKQPFVFSDLVKRVAEIKGMSESEVMERISYLYTDLNIDGRFINLGDNRWGLRTWYPYEQMEEEVTQTVRRKKTKKADDVDLDEDFDDLNEELDDEYEDLEDELDELVSDEDDEDEDEDDEFDIDLDDDADTDDDSEDEDLDEDLEEDDEDDFL